MPMEGQWQRQKTPLRRLQRHERRLLAIVVGLTALVSAVVVALAIGTGSEKLAPGCLRITTGGTTGAFVLHPCGADAIAFCRQQAPRGDNLARQAHEACRRARIAAG